MSDVADVAAVSEHLCWQLVAKVKHTLLHRHAAISLDAGVLSSSPSFSCLQSVHWPQLMVLVNNLTTVKKKKKESTPAAESEPRLLLASKLRQLLLCVLSNCCVLSAQSASSSSVRLVVRLKKKEKPVLMAAMISCISLSLSLLHTRQT